MKTIRELFKLEGRTALVTGSSRGIGRAIARTLAEAGAKVYVHCRRHDDNLEQAICEINEAGGEAVAVAADIGNSAELRGMLADIQKENTLDILVLNASVQSYQHFEDFSAEELDRQVHVNIRSSFEMIQSVLPGMKEQKWGRLLAIGSVNQYKPSPRLAIYSSLKAALSNMMLNCARQYASFGITANTLAPGVIVTDRNREVLADDEFCDNILKLIPANRLGNVDDCAGMALLLCSEAGSYITGSDIPVAGGMQL